MLTKILLQTLGLVHDGSAIAWMVLTFMMARPAGHKMIRERFRLLMIFASLAFATGAVRWWLFHRFAFGPMERVLAIGVACAVIAAGVQGALVRRRPVTAVTVSLIFQCVALAAMLLSRFAI